MHAVASSGLGGLDQRFDVEIGAHGIVRRPARAANLARLGRDADMERERGSRDVYTDRLHPERRRGARDADRDFTSVGNQYSLEQTQFPNSTFRRWSLATLRLAQGMVEETNTNGTRIVAS